MIERIIVAGGGTGGHLFPGLAVVEELRRRAPDLDVLFVGTERGIEARLLPARGEKLELLEVNPLKGRTAGQLAKSVAMLPMAMTKAAAIVRGHRPDLVIGVGGYASGPIVAAAAAMGVPTALLEQNAHVGLTNRMLAPLVRRAYLTYESTLARFGTKKGRAVGNPVRRAFVDAARLALVDPDGFEARSNRVLVMGGSQGAKALNETVPEALARSRATELGYTIVHQTGAAMRDEVEARYRELGVEAEVVAFIDDMAQAYASASIVVARAGASTLAELCAIGRPSVLIPYPYAADDHQAKNAEELEAAGAAICIRESALQVDGLAETITELLGSRERRRAMADAARGQGRPDAAAAVVDDLCEWLGCRARRPSLPVGGGAGPVDAAGGNEDEPEPRLSLGLRGVHPYVPLRKSSVPPAGLGTRRRLVLRAALSTPWPVAPVAEPTALD